MLSLSDQVYQNPYRYWNRSTRLIATYLAKGSNANLALLCRYLILHHTSYQKLRGACKIRLVQDNLNTHNASSFYENLPAAEAFALAQRFEFYYTPKSASWLNMIGIEFSALARACLHQRTPTIEELQRQVLALVAERHEQHIKINWQLSIETARGKLSRHYNTIRPDPVGVKLLDT